MRNDRLIRPGKRTRRINIKPSASAASNPLSDYLVPPTDSKGRSIAVHVGLPPSIPRLATVLLLKSKLPFRTPQDIYRWAIHNSMELLVRLIDDKDVHSDWSQISGIMAVGAKEMENIEYEEGLRTTLRRIAKLARTGHEVKAVQLAELMWQRGDTMEDPHWRVIFRNSAKKALDQLKRGVDVTVTAPAVDVDEDEGRRRVTTAAKRKRGRTDSDETVE